MDKFYASKQSPESLPPEILDKVTEAQDIFHKCGKDLAEVGNIKPCYLLIMMKHDGCDYYQFGLENKLVKKSLHKMHLNIMNSFGGVENNIHGLN